MKAQYIQVRSVQRTNNSYSDLVTFKNRLFAVTKAGKIIVWDMAALDTLPFYYPLDTPLRFTCVANYGGYIFAGTNQGNIFKIDPVSLSCIPYTKSKYGVLNIVFNSKGKMFLIVPYALYDPETDRLWGRFKHSSVKGLSTKRKRYFSLPEVVFIDGQDKLWMGRSLGEWGSRMQLFDTRNERKLKDKINGLDYSMVHIQSIFSDGSGNIYITSGLQHFSTAGKIYKISKDGVATVIYDSWDYKDTTENGLIKDPLFVGPGDFSSTNSCIYFASADGIYKATFSDSGKLNKPEVLFTYALEAEREPYAMGMKTAVKKLKAYADGTLLFLTEKNGIGIFDGEQVLLFQ